MSLAPRLLGEAVAFVPLGWGTVLLYVNSWRAFLVTLSKTITVNNLEHPYVTQNIFSNSHWPESLELKQDILFNDEVEEPEGHQRIFLHA